ncbi:hypothetical protein H920_17194 [Fukomys damarensis]|uniref:Uncharacterized protein n=1 Tax=Fukomys damarensis TaxID=885580 RepID=A0A091CUP0_FUKDA|nr:hypothetical protein H920_17194 [Fukomys damarensis]
MPGDPRVPWRSGLGWGRQSEQVALDQRRKPEKTGAGGDGVEQSDSKPDAEVDRAMGSSGKALLASTGFCGICLEKLTLPHEQGSDADANMWARMCRAGSWWGRAPQCLPTVPGAACSLRTSSSSERISGMLIRLIPPHTSTADAGVIANIVGHRRWSSVFSLRVCRIPPHGCGEIVLLMFDDLRGHTSWRWGSTQASRAPRTARWLALGAGSSAAPQDVSLRGELRDPIFHPPSLLLP